MTVVNAPFDLQRFVNAQNPVYEQVCAELRAGQKEGHWMWFVFPQLKGLGHSAMADAPSWTPVGRIVSIVGRPEGATPCFSATVTSWDQNTGTIGVTPDPNGIVQEGDALIVRFKADASNASTPTSIADSGVQNNGNPNGMTPGAEIGNLIRVIQGVSRGTPPRKIVANTATTITWDLPMVINPGDVWIIEEPTWPYSCDTTSIDNGDPLATTTINMPTSNFVDTALVIGTTASCCGTSTCLRNGPRAQDRASTHSSSRATSIRESTTTSTRRPAARSTHGRNSPGTKLTAAI